MSNPIPLRREALKAPKVDNAANEDIGAAVGLNLRRLRGQRGLSLEGLAKQSGVSRAMLRQIELGLSTPTISTVFKITRAFGIPFSALLTSESGDRVHVLPVGQSTILTSASGAFTSRALFPIDVVRKTEFYELRLAPESVEEADAHPAGTLENLVVVRGLVEIETAGNIHRLQQGDAILFQADRRHSYRNLAKQDALIYLVMTYQEVPH